LAAGAEAPTIESIQREPLEGVVEVDQAEIPFRPTNHFPIP
jgi:hypothetical protein